MIITQSTTVDEFRSKFESLPDSDGVPLKSSTKYSKLLFWFPDLVLYQSTCDNFEADLKASTNSEIVCRKEISQIDLEHIYTKDKSELLYQIITMQNVHLVNKLRYEYWGLFLKYYIFTERIQFEFEGLDYYDQIITKLFYDFPTSNIKNTYNNWIDEYGNGTIFNFSSHKIQQFYFSWIKLIKKYSKFLNYLKIINLLKIHVAKRSKQHYLLIKSATTFEELELIIKNHFPQSRFTTNKWKFMIPQTLQAPLHHLKFTSANEQCADKLQKLVKIQGLFMAHHISYFNWGSILKLYCFDGEMEATAKPFLEYDQLLTLLFTTSEIEGYIKYFTSSLLNPSGKDYSVKKEYQMIIPFADKSIKSMLSLYYYGYSYEKFYSHKKSNMRKSYQRWIDRAVRHPEVEGSFQVIVSHMCNNEHFSQFEKQIRDAKTFRHLLDIVNRLSPQIELPTLSTWARLSLYFTSKSNKTY
ncbi:hypothetical protein C6P40_004986 [Pichia californica]|uniref:Uncharacterized protein n=1 Tax=Pichia californica TaxID=460514 RepID=A0A9P7BGN8_9ASCO|nr:hypothetical protein C6P42_005344 [[Candida] californica]KAG0689450.1 hypothetical protein C6P40_004986 [[Candida] californica]